MKGIQSKIEAEQQSLSATTSASYLALVNSAKPDLHSLPDVDQSDPVPAAVAGFITTLGVDLTEEQQQQLQNMLKRPTTNQEDDSMPNVARRRFQTTRLAGNPDLLCLETSLATGDLACFTHVLGTSFPTSLSGCGVHHNQHPYGFAVPGSSWSSPRGPESYRPRH